MFALEYNRSQDVPRPMKVTFEDADGRTGVVTDDLDVEYDGQWEPAVRDRVEAVREEHEIEGQIDEEVVLDTLVIELPKEPRVVEAQRRHEKHTVIARA